MNDAMYPLEGRGETGDITDISFYNFEVRVGRQPIRSEKHEVIDSYGIPSFKKFGGKNTTDIAGPAGDKHLFHEAPFSRNLKGESSFHCISPEHLNSFKG